MYFRLGPLLCASNPLAEADTMEPLPDMSDEALAALSREALALPDAPADWLRRATAIGVPAPARPWKSLAGALAQQVAAAMSFDSWGSPALATGMRSMPDRTRHLLFSAKGHDIDLRIIPVAERFAMAGQVLGPDDSGLVELVHHPMAGAAEHEAQVATLDELGEFRFIGLRQGTVSITLHLGQDEVILPSIEVGERRV